MNLLEILQIVAFSKKTGTLRVESSTARGAVLFEDGLVLCAFSPSTAALAKPLAGDPHDPSRAALHRERVRVALRELVGLREGSFEFRLSRETPTQWEGIDVSECSMGEGVDPQELMLELARELDEARRDSTSLLESSDPTAPDVEAPAEEMLPPGESETTVVLVDDEPQVLEALSSELSSSGFAVQTASGPEEALSILDQLLDSGRLALVVTDVAMPSASGASFQGGLDIVERLKDMDGTTPVMLMAESLSPLARSRAKGLGIRKVAFKPALTKLDADEYQADLRSFAFHVRRELTAMVRARRAASAPPTVPELNHDVMFEFLKTMTGQLAQPANGISRMILRVASKYVERALLFLVKGARANGLAGLRLGRPTKQVVEAVRSIKVELQEVRPLAEVVYSRAPLYLTHERDTMPPEIEPGRACEYVLLPLLHNHEVLAILFGDNPNSGKPLGKLAGLELFLTQAGMAMENASLHRRLRSLDSQFSIEDQGPLTQELTRLTRDRK